MLIFHSGIHNLNEYIDFEGRNVGHIASADNRVEIIVFLWKIVKFDFRKTDLKGRTPLDDAKFFNNHEIIKILDPLISI